MTKHTFTEEENQQIHFACELIRKKLLKDVLMDGIKNQITDTHKNIKRKLQMGSEIYAHIAQLNWEELFKNKDWLEILRDLSTTYSLFGDKFGNQIKFIAKTFPQETEHALQFVKVFG